MFAGEERGDLQMSAEGLHPFDGPGYVVSLLRLELQGGDLEPVAVKGAILVCDQDNVLESVDVDEKMKLSRYRAPSRYREKWRAMHSVPRELTAGHTVADSENCE